MGNTAGMIDLRIPKESKDMMAKLAPSPVGPAGGPLYPWGLRINFDDDQIEKIAELQGLKAGQKLTITAECSVVRSSAEERMGEDNKPKKDRRVELQIQRVSVDNAPQLADDFAAPQAGEEE